MNTTSASARVVFILDYFIIVLMNILNKKQKMRISVPQEKIEKFKEVLLYILECIGARPNIGEAVVCKIMYFIDFDFYEKFEEQLMGAKYIKNGEFPKLPACLSMYPTAFSVMVGITSTCLKPGAMGPFRHHPSLLASPASTVKVGSSTTRSFSM